MSVKHEFHVELDPLKCGGKPCISGTRVRVWDVHVWHELRGWSAAEIVSQFPQLTLADIYGGLAYYHDHRDEIEHQMRGSDGFADQLKVSAGPSPLDRLREQERLDAAVSS